MRPRTAGAAVVAALALCACTGARPRALVPPDVQFVSRAEWDAKPPVLPMRAHALGRLTIHHTGTNQNFNRTVADKLASHRDYARTECPGANLYAELPRLRELIRARR